VENGVFNLYILGAASGQCDFSGRFRSDGAIDAVNGSDLSDRKTNILRGPSCLTWKNENS